MSAASFLDQANAASVCIFAGCGYAYLLSFISVSKLLAWILFSILVVSTIINVFGWIHSASKKEENNEVVFIDRPKGQYEEGH